MTFIVNNHKFSELLLLFEVGHFTKQVVNCHAVPKDQILKVSDINLYM